MKSEKGEANEGDYKSLMRLLNFCKERVLHPTESFRQLFSSNSFGLFIVAALLQSAESLGNN